MNNQLKKKKPPKITVLMSVYNGEKYLHEATLSILNQTFGDFEFLIVDDGSTDNTWQILNDYAVQDNRILLMRNKKNIGLTRSLNKCLAVAQGKYIARMDADDISLPDRFATQIEIMETSQVDICGTAMQIIDNNQNIIGIMGPKEKVDSDLPASILDESTWLLHPTIMMSRSALEEVGGYNPYICYAQDFDLWARMFLARKRATVIPIALVQYREHLSQISKVFYEDQFYFVSIVIKEYISSLLGDKTTEHAAYLVDFFLVSNPHFVEKRIPDFTFSQIFSLRKAFYEKFSYFDNSVIGFDKRVAKSALSLLRDSNYGLKRRIKFIFLYLFAGLSICYQRVLPKGICANFYGLINRLHRFLKRKYQRNIILKDE